jgi:hypothetical protein
MRCETVAVGCHRLRIGLFERFSSASHFGDACVLRSKLTFPSCFNDPTIAAIQPGS